MAPIGSQARSSGEEHDAFLPYRDRIVYALASVSVVVFLPFSTNNFLQGRYALGVATLIVVLILTIDAAAIYRGRKLPIPLWILVFPVVGGLTLTMLVPLYIGLAWAYPAIILFYFILPQHTANWVAGLVATAVTGLSYFAFAGTEYHMMVTTRLAATLALTAILSNIFIKIISELQQQLRQQTILDPLTSAYNRRHMDTILADAVERTRRGAASPSLLMIDVDHFKRINDNFGHAVGDRVLQDVVAIVREQVRRSDTLFRSGGEEFVLFLPETELDGAVTVAEQIRDSVAKSGLIDDWPVTISVGVSGLQAGECLDDWLRHGDEALYEAKRSGRNRVCAQAVAVAASSPHSSLAKTFAWCSPR